MEKLELQLSELYASGDQQAAAAAGKRVAELRPVVDAYRDRRTTESELAEAREMLTGESDAEMREYLESEIGTKQSALEALDDRLRELLVPRDPDDGKNVMVEIRGGEGGEEGNLWARRPLGDVPALRRPPPLEGRDPRQPALRHGWGAGGHLRREG